MKTIFYDGTAVLPDRLEPDAVVVCEQGRIEWVGARREAGELPKSADWISAGGGYISPGYVDLHVHGGDGADFMDGTVEAVQTATRAHARHGTTSIFPTTTTGSPEQIAAMIESCKLVQQDQTSSEAAIRNPQLNGARICGVHFYGPYFAEDKVGCHLVSGRRDPDAEEYRRALNTGMVRIATCAAELPGAEDFYRAAAQFDCLVTCGHSNASWNEMRRAFEAGMRHVDHFWCAMSSVPSIRARMGTPSQGSMEQFVLMHRDMSTEVIADGCHLAPELLEFAYVMKGSDRLCLVTDANRAMDQPAGRYRFGPVTDGEWFESDGNVGRQAGGGLASAIVGMDFMVRHMVSSTSAGVVDAIRMASLTPAERAGVASEVGSLTTGKRADILILDRDLYLKQVFIGGNPL